MKDSVIETNVKTGIIAPDKEIELAGAVVLDLLFKVTDKRGRVTDERFEQGHSFLANFIKLLYCNAMMHEAPMADGVALSLVDTGGTTRVGSTNYAHQLTAGGLGESAFEADAPEDDTSYGVLVGTDDGTILPKDINNYALGALIPQGTGSGQMDYGGHSIVPTANDGSSYAYAGITRSFTCNSVGSIDVKEVGLACEFYWDANASRYFLMTRDILGTPITVPAGQVLTASIRIKCYC